MQLILALIGAALAAVPTPLARTARQADPTWDVLGLELPCRDLERATAFYEKLLGYEVVRANKLAVILRLDEVLLVLDTSRALPEEEPSSQLYTSRALPEEEPSSQLYLNYRVADLEAAAQAVEEQGGTLLVTEPQAFVLGHSLSFLDPDGNRGNLVRLAAETEPAERLPAIFNLAVTAPGLAALEDFFCAGLAFEVYTRSYLPRTLPLVQRGGAMLVVHPEEEGHAGQAGCGAAILMLAPAGAAADAERTSPVFGEALVRRGPGGLEVVGVSRDALAQAIEGQD